MQEFEKEIIQELSFIDSNSVNMQQDEIKGIIDKLCKIAEAKKVKNGKYFWNLKNCIMREK